MPLLIDHNTLPPLLGVCSSDVQSELSGLGVSVYNQQEFEAGVLKQIDTEVQRRHAEQDKKFLLKEHHNVKGEIRLVDKFSVQSVECLNNGHIKGLALVVE